MAGQIPFVKDLPRYEVLREAAEHYPELDPSSCYAFLHLLRTGDELLALVRLDLEPVARAPALGVLRVQPLGDDALEPLLLRGRTERLPVVTSQPRFEVHMHRSGWGRGRYGARQWWFSDCLRRSPPLRCLSRPMLQQPKVASHRFIRSPTRDAEPPAVRRSIRAR